MNEMDRHTVQSKVEEYQKFLNSKLRPELTNAKNAKQGLEAEISEYQDLLDKLSKIRDISVMTVDLGWNKAYCEAQVDANSNIFVEVAHGFHVELTLTEAAEFCHKRIHFLNSKLAHQKKKVKQVEEHVSTAEDILDHLANEALTLP